MKKALGMLLVFMLILGVLAACGGNTETAAPSGSDATEQQSENTNDDATKPTFESRTIALGHATSDSENSHYHQGALKFKELVEEATDGQVTIEIHPNGVLGGEREMIEAVQLGTVDMVFTSTGPVGNFASKSNAFDFPFLFRDREHAYKVLDGEIGEEVNQQLESAGLKVLVWAENGFRNITNSTHPIKTPDDLKGVKIRTMENKIHLDSFRQFGADPTPMAFTELFTALQQGVVDAQENPLSVIIPNKFYEVQDYLTLTGHFYSPAPLIINKDLFDSFSPELQDVITKAAEEMRDFEREFIYQQEQEYLKIAEENGMEIIQADEYDFEAFFEAAQPVYEKYADEYGDILDRIIATE
ncbi:tripartite ATP-independent transporter DctP family solute receptor [Caldalkalibacillus uzonensis]|uniref:Tripartite ATP-independent transporter DctP family solute receptor n=1 Tax=Caldalkalibacillus uzonensis TaxID=353224 RepID=A0ABU0CPC9_9BACI|nr:TRAP transporter substrate-binding protein [Caldalkalibacillus uzonensis]MDQ0338273.1 tripartite ATP-independent transporter DctP family solute receptor [Caldalkalibacillus uzonensis]